MSPDFTLRLAVLNSSLPLVEYLVYRFCSILAWLSLSGNVSTSLDIGDASHNNRKEELLVVSSVSKDVDFVPSHQDNLPQCQQQPRTRLLQGGQVLSYSTTC
jgi:hypothetical protein